LAFSWHTNLQHCSSETVVSWIIMLIGVSHMLKIWVRMFKGWGWCCVCSAAGGCAQWEAVWAWGRLTWDHPGPERSMESLQAVRRCSQSLISNKGSRAGRKGTNERDASTNWLNHRGAQTWGLRPGITQNGETVDLGEDAMIWITGLGLNKMLNNLFKNNGPGAWFG
jgi:hypothetical protein